MKNSKFKINKNKSNNKFQINSNTLSKESLGDQTMKASYSLNKYEYSPYEKHSI